ncbi:hypothetical protein FVER14953_11959 [Fusarium verticillioides]|nr:hypothetical protein FVER14953_11959 [Fusarium verticillioides]
MQSSILPLASAMVLISQAIAGAISPREASLAHFQIFGDDNCTNAESMGEFNLYSEDTDKCHTFPTDKAVNSVYISYIGDECAVGLYTGTTCSTGSDNIGPNFCYGRFITYGSYNIVCA